MECTCKHQGHSDICCVRECTSQAIAGVNSLPNHHVVKYFSCPILLGGDMLINIAAEVTKAWWMRRTHLLLGAKILSVNVLRLFLLFADRHELR